MSRKRPARWLLGGGCCLALTSWFLTAAVGPAAGQVNSTATGKVSVVTVTAGKPTELAFKLSKSSNLPVGKIIFKVTNAGRAVHDFKLCTAPVTTTPANTCVGKVTKKLRHGDTATLTVTFKNGGRYEYLCSVVGHANAGMKGILGIGVAVAASASGGADASATPSSVTKPAGAGVGGGPECPEGLTIVQAVGA